MNEPRDSEKQSPIEQQLESIPAGPLAGPPDPSLRWVASLVALARRTGAGGQVRPAAAATKPADSRPPGRDAGAPELTASVEAAVTNLRQLAREAGAEPK